MAGVSRGVTWKIAVRQQSWVAAHGRTATRRNRLATKRVRAEKITRAKACRDDTPLKASCHFAVRPANARFRTKPQEIHGLHSAHAVGSETSAGARRAEEATRGTSHSVVEGRRKSRGTDVIGRESGDDTEYGVVRLRNFQLLGRNSRSRLLTLMTLRARTGRSRLRKTGSRVAHQVLARRMRTIHRVTTMTSQIIATGCPSGTGIQRNERDQPQRQTTASEQAPRQRLEKVPPHLEPPGTKLPTIKLQKPPGSCELRSSCLNRWNPLRLSHPKSCEQATEKLARRTGEGFLRHRMSSPRLRVLKLRLFGFPPQRGDAMPAQGNALGWRMTLKTKP